MIIIVNTVPSVQQVFWWIPRIPPCALEWVALRTDLLIISYTVSPCVFIFLILAKDSERDLQPLLDLNHQPWHLMAALFHYPGSCVHVPSSRISLCLSDYRLENVITTTAGLEPLWLSPCKCIFLLLMLAFKM